MNIVLSLHVIAGNVNFVKLAKSLSNWKIKQLMLIKKQIDEKTLMYKKKFNNIRVTVNFFFDKKQNSSPMDYSKVKYKILTPYTYDLIKFFGNDKIKSIEASKLIEIAKIKMKDLNVLSIESAVDVIKGSCKSCNYKILN